jgi:hypothetical protein
MLPLRDVDIFLDSSKKTAYFLDDDFFYVNFLFQMNFELPLLEWRVLFKAYNFSRYFSFLLFGRTLKIYHFDYKMYRYLADLI